MVAGAAGVVFFLCLSGFQIRITPFSALMALLLSLIGLCTNLLGIMVMWRGKISLYMLLLMLGGMLLPFAVGLLFWNEPLSVFRVIGLILLVCALFIPMREKADEKRGNRILFILCGAVFVINGCTSIFSKLHQISPGNIDTISFMVITNALNFIIAVSALAVVSLKNKIAGRFSRPPADGNDTPYDAAQPFFNKKNIVIIISSSLVGGLSYMLQLMGAITLDASLLYPMVTGGTIVMTTLFGSLFFKEKASKYTVQSVVLACLATFLFIF
jgi:drug/metabolite transporter (DMT)-like permease